MNNSILKASMESNRTITKFYDMEITTFKDQQGHQRVLKIVQYPLNSDPKQVYVYKYDRRFGTWVNNSYMRLDTFKAGFKAGRYMIS